MALAALCLCRWWLAGEKLKSRLKKIGKWTLDIIKRSDKTKAFEILPAGGLSERTFAWLGRCRRLAKDSRNPSLQPRPGSQSPTSACSRGGLQDIAIVDHFSISDS